MVQTAPIHHREGILRMRIWRRRGASAPAMLLIPAIIVAGAMALPLAYLVLRTFDAGGEAWELLARWQTLRVLGRSALLAAAVTGTAVALSVPLAWLTIRSDMPGKRVWSVLTVLPLVVPSYIGGFALVSALGPKGLAQQALEPLGVDRLPEIYGFPGAWLALTLFSYPYVLLSVRGAMAGLDPAEEEASRSLGRGSRETFFRVTLPQLRPAIGAGGLLVALYTLSDFGAVSLLRFNSFTRVIYLQYEGSFDRTLAAVLALVLVALGIGLVAWEQQLRGRARYYSVGSGTARRAPVAHLGGWRWPAFALTALLVLVALGIPASVLLYWLAQGLAHHVEIGFVGTAAAHAVYAAGLAAGAAVLAALPVAILAVRFPRRHVRVLEAAAYVGFAMPGIVVALALVFFGANFATPLYQTLFLLVLAYVVLFLPMAVGALRASLLQVNPAVEEAARSLGRSPLQVLATVTLPLMRSGIVVGAALVFLTAMKELPATLLLSPLGFKTLATEVWSAADIGFFSKAAVPALLLIGVSSIPVAILLWRERAPDGRG